MGHETKSKAPVTPRTSARANGYNLRTAQKSERCSDCGKLVRPDEMEKHMRYHGGYSCPKCHKTFADKNSLQKHSLTHSDVDKQKEKEKTIKALTPPAKAKKVIAKTKVTAEINKPKRLVPLKPKAQETAEKNGSLTVSPPPEKNQSVPVSPPSDKNQSASPSSDKIESASPPSDKTTNNLTPQKAPEAIEPNQELPDPSIPNSSKSVKIKSHNVINSIRKKYNLPASKNNATATPNSYPCHCCALVFTTLRLRTRHVLLHHKQHPYQCQYCSKSFLRSSSLTQHSTFHTEMRPFKCHMCPATFRYHSNLYSHRFTHQEYGSLECNVCGKKFKHSTTLWSHVQKHREELGGKSTRFSNIVKFDDNGVEGEEGECGQNEGDDVPLSVLAENWVKQESKPELDLENPPHLDPEEYHTPTFMTHDDFDRITMAAAAEQIKSVVKERKFLRDPPPLIPSPNISHELRIRKKMPESTSTTDTQITMCPICYKSFPLEYLQPHIQAHADPDSKPFQCQYCDKSYSKRFEVIQHEYSHTGERPYSCEHCGNTFRYKSNYCRHKRTRAIRGTCEGRARLNSYVTDEYGNSFQPKNSSANEEENGEDLNGDENLDDLIEEETGPAPWELFKFGAGYDEEGQEEEDDGRISSETDPLSDDGVFNNTSPEILARLNINLPDLIIDEVVMMDGEEEFAVHGQSQGQQRHGLHRRGPVSITLGPQQRQQIQNRNQSQIDFSNSTFNFNNHPDGPATCSVCNKQFQSQRHLTLHKRQHVKDRRVTCKLCNKTFAHRFSLTQHALVHTGEMPFSCDLCNKQFRFKSNYTKHNKQHHPELVPQTTPPQRYRKIPAEEIQYVDGGDKPINKNPVIIQHLQRQQQQQQQQQQIPQQFSVRISQSPVTAGTQQQQQHQHGFARLLPKLAPAVPPTTTQSQNQDEFPCNYCDEAFDDASELRLHTLSHKLGLSYSRTKSIDVE